MFGRRRKQEPVADAVTNTPIFQFELRTRTRMTSLNRPAHKWQTFVEINVGSKWEDWQGWFFRNYGSLYSGSFLPFTFASTPEAAEREACHLMAGARRITNQAYARDYERKSTEVRYKYEGDCK